MSLACLTNHWCYKQKQSNSRPRSKTESVPLIIGYFSLGMWIRNTWTYGNEEKRIDALAKDLGEDVFWDADSMSSAILEGYKKYLKKSCTKDKK